MNNTKIYANEGKEELHREHWEEVFNAEFEEDNTTEHVFEHLRNNIHRTIPYNSSDLSRLDSNVIDSTITEEEVKNIIKKVKENESGIKQNKQNSFISLS